MRHKFLKLFTYLLIIFSAMESDRGICDILSTLKISDSTKKAILSEKVFAHCLVHDVGPTRPLKKNSSLKTQKLGFKAASLLKGPCQKSLRPFSKYENYSDYFSFIQSSSYGQKEKNLRLLITHPLLPGQFTLNFTMERVKDEGKFSFEFPSGILQGLKGVINTANYSKNCLFTLKANWSGPHTNINSLALELFSETAAKLALAKFQRLAKLER